MTWPMRNEDVDATKLANGDYCRKGFDDCMCGVGWPYERQCKRCRDDRPKDDVTDFCYFGGCCWSEAEIKQGKHKD